MRRKQNLKRPPPDSVASENRDHVVSIIAPSSKAAIGSTVASLQRSEGETRRAARDYRTAGRSEAAARPARGIHGAGLPAARRRTRSARQGPGRMYDRDRESDRRGATRNQQDSVIAEGRAGCV